MNAHLTGNLGLLGVDGENVPLPLAAGLPAAPGALRSLRDERTVLARLELDHGVVAFAGAAASAAPFLAAPAGATSFLTTALPASSFLPPFFPPLSSVFLWASTTHSSRPSPGCRIVSPIRLSRGEISDNERETIRERVLYPTLRSFLVSTPTSRWLCSSTLTRSSMICETWRRPSNGPKRTKAPNFRISTTAPSTTSWISGLNRRA